MLKDLATLLQSGGTDRKSDQNYYNNNNGRFNTTTQQTARSEPGAAAHHPPPPPPPAAQAMLASSLSSSDADPSFSPFPPPPPPASIDSAQQQRAPSPPPLTRAPSSRPAATLAQFAEPRLVQQALAGASALPVPVARIPSSGRPGLQLQPTLPQPPVAKLPFAVAATTTATLTTTKMTTTTTAATTMPLPPSLLKAPSARSVAELKSRFASEPVIPAPQTRGHAVGGVANAATTAAAAVHPSVAAWKRKEDPSSGKQSWVPKTPHVPRFVTRSSSSETLVGGGGPGGDNDDDDDASDMSLTEDD
ncbi:hypothetical protein HK405_012924, partial [Cladochytrium tenue]